MRWYMLQLRVLCKITICATVVCGAAGKLCLELLRIEIGNMMLNIVYLRLFIQANIDLHNRHAKLK